MAIIQFTEIPTLKTVKPAKTVFLNNTGQDLVLKFVTAPDLMLPAYTISTRISAAIDCICLGATNYYSTHGQNYAIADGSTVVLSIADQTLAMVISP
ncbi:MAG TPA: hypothetical protein VN089_16865 [Duganella sp.]|nr:hypothetical protein [Duganella sp.]